MDKRRVVPRTFFLNETHELTPSERSGGGAPPKYEGILWAERGVRISQSIQAVTDKVERSNDPLKKDRYFVLALPVPALKKRSDDKKLAKKLAPDGTYEEETRFGGAHGRVFDRLGLDLLQVTDDGRAVVHAKKDKFDQLFHRTKSLESLGKREQARWATIDSFDTVPLELRVDADWLQPLRKNETTDIVIELHPVLSRLDADRVLRAIADLLIQQQDEKLTGTGMDFSGRHWFRGKARARSILSIAKDYFSVQSIHSPLFSIAAARTRTSAAPISMPQQAAPPPPDTSSLPCVAVVDLGVPIDHLRLKPYRRGQFNPLNAPRGAIGDHGSFVASRIVFGDCQTHEELSGATGRCTFMDVGVGVHPMVSGNEKRIDDMLVIPALQGVRSSSPDVRVFNLSFGNERALNSFAEVKRRENRLMLQNLDNFIFANDCIVVVAAGNSPPGVPPIPGYPNHHVDKRWALGPWACGYNTLVCGAFVSQLSTNGLAQTLGWPSPFTRIGPGLCDAPVPSFSAEGGNTDEAYQSPFSSGLGVWGFSAAGRPEDHAGSSHAAPILAREAAMALQKLQQFCAQGTQAFAVTARAFLTLTATAAVSDERVRDLVQHTLGCGKASHQRLVTPAAGSVVILWQGYIESSRDTVRVQLPIPLGWLREAEKPVLRLIVCSDPPVNETAQGGWACRRVRPVLHLGPDAPPVRAPTGSHPTYPVIDREYRLDRLKPGQPKAANRDLWLLEISYEEIPPYPPGMDFDPRQRVAFAAELVDRGESPVDPQSAMQALPIAPTMTHLSIQPMPIRSPILIKTRL